MRITVILFHVTELSEPPLCVLLRNGPKSVGLDVDASNRHRSDGT